MKFAFLIYPKLQLMDLVGPLEVLNMWRMLDPSIQILYIAETLTPIALGSGFTLTIDASYQTAPPIDVLCVPGGQGRLDAVHDPQLLSFIQNQYLSCKLITAICTGAFLLNQSGILKNQKATTYWRALPELAQAKHLTICEERIVKSGKIWTSGGVTSGIDLMLAVVAAFGGREMAGKVQLLLEYFPNNTIYCQPEDISDLPAYNTEKNATDLPTYIRKYLSLS